MDINPVALARIAELEAEAASSDAELADAYALINTLENLLTSTEVKLSLALAQNALMMSDRMYTHESHAD